jgi:hypothetical protein
MLMRILRFLAVLAVGLFALRAYAHKLECEKEVGLVQLDAQGNVVLGADGLPVFTSPPSTILSLDTYPAAVGWRIRVSNLATETSVVSGFEDPLLASTTAQAFGTMPAPGLEIPVGECVEAIVVQRIGSFEECIVDDVLVSGVGSGDGGSSGDGSGGGGSGGGDSGGGGFVDGDPRLLNAAFVDGGENGPVCRDDFRDNVALVTTHADATSCRARIECSGGPPPTLLPVEPPPVLPEPPPALPPYMQ